MAKFISLYFGDLSVIILIQFVVNSSAYRPLYGMLLQKNSTATTFSSEKFCMLFYPEISNVSSQQQSVSFSPIFDASDSDVCRGSRIPNHHIVGRYVLIYGHTNCSYLEIASEVESRGGVGTLFVNVTRPPSQNVTGENLNFAFISLNTFNRLVSTDEIEVGLFSPELGDPTLNFGSLAIWLLAVMTVTIGAYWSGTAKHRLHLRDQGVYDICDSSQGGVGGLLIEEQSLNISPTVISVFVLLMCGMILSLYFLYTYLVYVIIFLFWIASTGAFYNCFLPLVRKIPCGTIGISYNNRCLGHGHLEVRQALLMVLALCISITWLVFRNASWAWVLQDFLGILFSINMLVTIRLPSLKICTLLLCLLFVYDIFFVFVTPFLTKDGNSIMVEVAQGGSGSGGGGGGSVVEQLPMVLKVPHFTTSEIMTVCNLAGNYNLLGFGDILVPGLLVSYVHSFDLIVGTPGRLYFVVNVVAYGLGLLVTYLGLYLMEYAQPALLYLVPFTLMPTCIIAAARGEYGAMWRGDMDKSKQLDSPEDDTAEDDAAAVVPDICLPTPPSPQPFEKHGSKETIS